MAAPVSVMVPQPHTIGASREDVLQNLQYFFGDPSVPEKLRDYKEHHAHSFHFPDAFNGRNERLRDTLVSLLMHAPDQWMTQAILPWRQMEGVDYTWDEHIYDPRILQRVPYEGTSRMVTSMRREYRARAVRRGIGLIIESGFYATEKGREDFYRSLQNIRHCVQETCNFDGLYALLTCDHYDFMYDRSKQMRSSRNVKRAMHFDIMTFGILQKDSDKGFDKVVELAKQRMARYGSKPDSIIISSSQSIFMTLAPEERYKYSVGGPAGPNEFKAGVEGFEARAFHGMGVFVSNPFEVSDTDSDALQLLHRNVQVGEYYIMSAPITGNGRRFPPGYMNIVIFDQESGRLTTIEFRQAMYATGFGGDLFTKDAFGFKKMEDSHIERIIKSCEMTKSHDGTDVSKVGFDDDGKVVENATNAQIKKVKEFFEQLKTGNYGTLTAEDVAKRIIGLVENGVYVPIEIFIVRPFIEHVMGSSVVLKAGSDTGNTLFSQADMQIAGTVQTKMIEGHFTCHTKSVVTKPKNVLVMRDISFVDYVAGANTIFFGQKDRRPFEELVDLNDVADDMDRRLNFHDDDTGRYSSLLAFPGHHCDAGSRPDIISISGRMLPWEVSTNNKDAFPGGSGNYEMYREKLRLNELHYGEDVRASENMEFLSASTMNNAMCFVGPHRVFNPLSAEPWQLVPGQGHLGSDARPGDERFRRGEPVSMMEARCANISVDKVTTGASTHW